MTDEPIKIRAALPNLVDKNGMKFAPEAYESMVEQINEKAKDGRLLGQIDSPNDGKTRFADISHKVLPNAKIDKDGSITASIEVLDTPMGRQLKAMLEHSPRRVSISSRGMLRGVGSSPEDMRITGIDFQFTPPQSWTVLDGIVDALDTDDKKED